MSIFLISCRQYLFSGVVILLRVFILLAGQGIFNIPEHLILHALLGFVFVSISFTSPVLSIKFCHCDIDLVCLLLTNDVMFANLYFLY